ncbi:hypothetical protein M1L60_18755 [Actinoplanes sp. TRM 88003]|uniref:PKD domain-containing protein n=1 Tax=Paractinoplanes aksuensis TaxID=2939490 RepID=A0ABT1DP82_9ACTN|nr:hypothetical protein [Actinoplanes aksuensis]MCO8272639.1 hypothetical protein [Actinoplanes aksuensis]
MKLVYRRGLPALCGAVLAAGVIGVGTPALAAGEPPTGTFTLNTASLWSGQQVTLTQDALADDDTTDLATITRAITWGDGTSTAAAAGETSWTHTYAGAGTFKVAVELKDDTVSGPGTIAAPNVTVTTAPGTLGWQKSTVYTASDGVGGTYLTEAVFTPKGLPLTADEAWTTWGDGEFSLLKQDATETTVPHYFDEGDYSPQVQLSNKFGKATPRTASRLNVDVDDTAPTSGFTFPANAGKGSSWKAFKGTGRDSQSGADIVEVIAFKWKGETVYYYNFETKKWVKVTDPTAYLPDGAIALSPVTAAGTWSVPASGITKGYHLEVDYWVYDKVGNVSADKYATAFISS